MQRSVFGTLHPFFEGGHINGRTIASAGFMTALLQRDPFREYHFFVARPDALAKHLLALPLKAVQRGAVHTLHRTALPGYLRREEYGVFHLSDPVSDYTPLCQARNVWAPHIFPVTTVNHTISYSHYGSAFLHHLWGGVSSRDAIGCNSHAAKAVLEQYFSHLQGSYGAEVCSHAPALHVVPMGVDPSQFAAITANPESGTSKSPPKSLEARHSMRARLNATENTVLFLLFGRIALADKMDPIPLMLALKRAKDAQPQLDMHLVMAGYCGPEDTAPDYLRAVSAMLGIAFHIMPNPSDAEKHDLYAAADVFVSPSDNIQETFGLSLLEAGAAHLPTVASDWNGYRDIIIHGTTGILIPTMAPAATPELDMLGSLLFDNQHHLLRSQQTVVSVPAMAEALVRLAQDPALRVSMGQQAHNRIMENFTWDKVVDAWLELWEDLRARPISPAEDERLRRGDTACPTEKIIKDEYLHLRGGNGVAMPVSTAQHPTLDMHKNAHYSGPAHPALLPMGSIYAPYATSRPTPSLRLRCTSMGEALRKGTVPFTAFATLEDLLPEKPLLALLVWARTEISIENLLARITAAPQEPGTSPAAPSAEKGLFYVLWAIKHDLLELCNECPIPHPMPRNPLLPASQGSGTLQQHTQYVSEESSTCQLPLCTRNA